MISINSSAEIIKSRICFSILPLRYLFLPRCFCLCLTFVGSACRFSHVNIFLCTTQGKIVELKPNINKILCKCRFLKIGTNILLTYFSLFKKGMIQVFIERRIEYIVLINCFINYWGQRIFINIEKSLVTNL